MSRKIYTSLLAVALLTTLMPASLVAKPAKKKAPPAPVETWPRDGIPGYAIVGLDGNNPDSLRVEAGQARATLPAIIANDIDLVTVVGSQTQVTLYQQPNFRGHSLTLRCGSYELLQQPRNDIESVQVRYVRDDRACQGTPEQPVQIPTWTR